MLGNVIAYGQAQLGHIQETCQTLGIGFGTTFALRFKRVGVQPLN